MLCRSAEWWKSVAFVAVSCSCVLGIWTCAAAASDTRSWTPLFNGRNLDGWGNPYDWGEARVDDGQILLQAERKFFLVTARRYRDFLFEGEVKMPDAQSNSGFMFRCHQEHNRVYGYQAEVDPSDRQWSGGLYDEGRRGWLNPRNNDGDSVKAFVESTEGAFRCGDWNRYRIHCVGPSIRIYVNGVLTTDYVDATDRDGYIAIQHHGEAGKMYRFRNLRVRELPAPAMLTEAHNSLPLVFFEDFESGTDRWTQTDPNAWKLIDQEGNHAYSQYQASRYEPPVRSPLNIARIKNLKVSDFVVQAKMEQTGREYGHRDMCVFFGYQDPSHFYYTHIATAADDAAHSIHIVNGAPRAPIVLERTKGADWGTGYHDVRVVRNVSTGSIEVFFDDMSKPVMRAVDRTFGAGGIGFGTFDDTGNIDDVIIWGRKP